MRSQALRADFLMLITAMIWGPPSWPSASAWTISAFLFTGLRFALGALALLPLVIYQGALRPGTSPSCSAA